MKYEVFADLSRRLSGQERAALFELLDSTIPDSGCVGSYTDDNDEVYFVLQSDSEEAARLQAERYIAAMIQAITPDIEYVLHLNPAMKEEK